MERDRRIYESLLTINTILLKRKITLQDYNTLLTESRAAIVACEEKLYGPVQGRRKQILSSYNDNI